MSHKIITNAITAVLALGISGTTLAEDQGNTSSMGNVEGMEKCYGIAKANRNDCGTKNHQCAGESKLNNSKSEWIHVPTGTCDKIVGGSLKPLEEK